MCLTRDIFTRSVSRELLGHSLEEQPPTGPPQCSHPGQSWAGQDTAVPKALTSPSCDVGQRLCTCPRCPSSPGSPPEPPALELVTNSQAHAATATTSCLGFAHGPKSDSSSPKYACTSLAQGEKQHTPSPWLPQHMIQKNRHLKTCTALWTRHRTESRLHGTPPESCNSSGLCRPVGRSPNSRYTAMELRARIRHQKLERQKAGKPCAVLHHRLSSQLRRSMESGCKLPSPLYYWQSIHSQCARRGARRSTSG